MNHGRTPLTTAQPNTGVNQIPPTNSSVVPAKEPSELDIVLAEYETLQEHRLFYSSFGENRLKLYLTVIGGVSAGIGLAHQWLGQGSADVAFWLSTYAYVGLLLFGFLTFNRTIHRTKQLDVLDRGLARLRRYMIQSYPDLEDHFVRKTHDDFPFHGRGYFRQGHTLSTLPGLIALINTMLTGAGLLLFLKFAWHWPLNRAMILSVAVAFLVYIIQQLYYLHRIAKSEKENPPKFFSST